MAHAEQIEPALKNQNRRMPTWFSIAILVLLVYLGFVFWAQLSFGSYRFALSYLQGMRLQIRPAAQPVGTHLPGEVYETVIRLSNHGAKPARILGAFSDCSCVGYRALPVTVQPGETVTLPVSIRFGKIPGDWRQSVTYMTDDTRQPILRAELVGRVVTPSVRPGLVRELQR